MSRNLYRKHHLAPASCQRMADKFSTKLLDLLCFSAHISEAISSYSGHATQYSTMPMLFAVLLIRSKIYMKVLMNTPCLCKFFFVNIIDTYPYGSIINYECQIIARHHIVIIYIWYCWYFNDHDRGNNTWYKICIYKIKLHSWFLVYLTFHSIHCQQLPVSWGEVSAEIEWQK